MGSVILFGVIALVVLGGALGVILARNPVHSALFLVASLIGMAGFFLMQNADLVAAVQIVVYASAIVVLFLFVIMLLGVDRHEPRGDEAFAAMAAPQKVLRILGPVLAVALGIGVMAVVGFAGNQWATGEPSTTAALSEGENTRLLAEHLFTTYLWPFEVTAALLVIAVIGGVVLARRSRQKVRAA
jgi:NADH-quinone oxidoreductase subunit J